MHKTVLYRIEYLTIPVFSNKISTNAIKMFVLWDTHVIQKHNSVVHVFVSPSESGHNYAFHEKKPKKKNHPVTHKKVSFHNFLLHKLLLVLAKLSLMCMLSIQGLLDHFKVWEP